MATPALRLLRDSLKGTFMGGLVRPGIDQVLGGSPFFDHLHVERARGMMGPKRVASGLRAMRYDTALLLTNSLSTALIARLAWIPRRVGYDRDGRGLLLTDRIPAKRREGGRDFAIVPAVEYYLTAARWMLGERASVSGLSQAADAIAARLELFTTAEDEGAGEDVLSRALPNAEVRARPIAVINPGANDAAKRWPADRFAAVAAHLAMRHGMAVLVSGSPGERELAESVTEQAGASAGAGAVGRIAALPGLGVTIGSLKAILRRARLLVTNDTGPRHLGAAFGVPTITLFGPTDPRWTTLPVGDDDGAQGGTRRIDLVADPTLPESEQADDHPERCRIDRIDTRRVIEAADRLIAGPEPAGPKPAGGPRTALSEVVAGAEDGKNASAAGPVPPHLRP